MVRLKQEQIDTLVRSTKECFGTTAEIWLFGSRADDSKKGGDIDLAIETDMFEGVVKAKLDFRRRIWSVFGEQKIDIVVHSRQASSSPIHDLAKSTGVWLG